MNQNKCLGAASPLASPFLLTACSVINRAKFVQAFMRFLACESSLHFDFRSEGYEASAFSFLKNKERLTYAYS